MILSKHVDLLLQQIDISSQQVDMSLQQIYMQHLFPENPQQLL